MKLSQDSQDIVLAELQQKMASMETEMQRADQTRTDLRDKLRNSEEQNMQMANFIKSLQSQSETELAQMRNFMQTKLSEDHAN